MRHVATIDPHSTSTVKNRVAQLNRRAEKLGAEKLVLTFGETRREVEILENGFEVIHEVVDVIVTGPQVKLDGWRFVAAIDHQERLVRTAPEFAGESFHHLTDSSDCDQCHTNRERHQTYVLRHADGRQVQVGSTCVNDFLGHKLSLFVAEATFALEDEWESAGSGGFFGWGLETFLATTEAMIRQHGWTPRSKADGIDSIATRDMVTATLSNSSSDPKLTGEDWDRARAAIAWALEMDPRSDYDFNLRAIAENGFVTPRSAGLAASMQAAFRRAEAKRVEREAANANASPVPVTDERQTVTGVLTHIDYRDTAYGTRIVGTILSDEGYRVWGTLPKQLRVDAEVGSRVQFVARLARSNRDEFFGFFSRPTKAKALEAAVE